MGLWPRCQHEPPPHPAGVPLFPGAPDPCNANRDTNIEAPLRPLWVSLHLLCLSLPGGGRGVKEQDPGNAVHQDAALASPPPPRNLLQRTPPRVQVTVGRAPQSLSQLWCRWKPSLSWPPQHGGLALCGRCPQPLPGQWGHPPPHHLLGPRQSQDPVVGAGGQPPQAWRGVSRPLPARLVFCARQGDLRGPRSAVAVGSCPEFPSLPPSRLTSLCCRPWATRGPCPARAPPCGLLSP